MSLRFITPNQHGVLDFTVATALIGLPFALGLGASSPLAFWLSIVTGVAVVVLSLMTDYRFGLLRVIPFKGHLLVDGIVGIAFLLAPVGLGFTGIDALYYWMNGAGVIAVVSMGLTKKPAAIEAAHGHST